jgi:hypothetical protein
MTTDADRSKARVRAAIAFAALCAVLAGVAVVIAPADAQKAKRIGHTKHTPGPDKRVVEGRVTGFQKVADGRRGLFKAPRNGKIVGWAVNLSKPSKSDQDFFKSIFFAGKNNQPTAQIAVLRHQKGRKYKLLHQSPKVKLRGYMGHKQVITLNHPLKINKGNLLALTMPTWAPAFAQVNPPGKNRWRGSRSPDNCAPKNSTFKAKKRFAQHSRPHKEKGSVRRYGCDYRGGRLLYWGYFVTR